jgi:glycosyltransferase involved in cell wall biosynthesis
MEDIDQPLVSIVIPMYNRRKTIDYCLTSVLNQTYRNLEIILVDDYSTDDTVRYIRNTYTDKRIRIVQQKENGGAQKARNAGIKNAKGEWIAFLDSDDEWLSQKIEKQVEILEENNFNPYLVIHSDALVFDYEKNIKYIFGVGIFEGEKKCVYEKLLRKSGPFFQAMLTSKKALEEIGYLDENVPSYQEWDTSIRLAKICDFIFMKEVTFIYHLHKGETISKDIKRDIEGYSYIMNKFKSEMNIYLTEADLKYHFNVINQKKYQLFPFGKIPENSRVILYGAGNRGKVFYNKAKETNFCEIVLWLDKKADGTLVKKPETVANLNVDYDFVYIAIESETIVLEVKKFLMEYGVPENKIEYAFVGMPLVTN